MKVLVVNAGSSSVKLTLLGDDDEMLLERSAAPGEPLGELPAADVIGHRIVHGGERFREPVLIDPEVEDALRQLTALAPLHQPKSLAALDAVSRALPGVPAVACFDTAFHATLPDAAAVYALPAGWRERWGVRRYGFHGLSHAWVARRAPAVLGVSAASLRIVSCHLGAGASLCAIAGGRSVDTTMGFTPLEGLVMATRSGSVDPGLLLWLLERTGMRERALARALEHESGLLGLTGTADMREVLARAASGAAGSGDAAGAAGSGDAAGAAGSGAEQFALGLNVYLHRLRAGIASMAASLGGLDALVFTGGVGERSAVVRARACEGLAFLGVAVDPRANDSADGDCEMTGDGAAVRTVVLRAREDLEIARQTRGVVRP